jgi:hypothetical protein
VKSHSGTQAARHKATPDVECLADHFAKKLTVPNADDPVPDFAPVEVVKLLDFRITKERLFRIKI